MVSSSFSQIMVLQSLQVADMRTGERLCENIESWNLFYDRGLKVSFEGVQTKQEFLGALQRLAFEAARGIWPLLHIECHGSDDQTGIVLADGSCLTWTEMKPYLTAINIEARCNLLVVLGACYGAHLSRIILPTDRAPYSGLIAPTDQILPNELLSRFNSFYKELLQSMDGGDALQALLEERLKSGGYYYTTADHFFREVYEHYVEEQCSPLRLEQRAKALSRRIKKARANSQPSKGAVKRFLSSLIQPTFEKHHRKFFMIDLYPENAQRFTANKEVWTKSRRAH
jgi:hypothetical protein